MRFGLLYFFLVVSFFLGVSAISGVAFILGFEIEGLYNNLILTLTLLFLFGMLTKNIQFYLSNYFYQVCLLFLVASLSVLFTPNVVIGLRKYQLFFAGGLLLTIFASSISSPSLKFVQHIFIGYSILNILVLIQLGREFGMEELKWNVIVYVKSDVIYFSRVLGLGVLSLFFLDFNIVIKWILIIVHIYFVILLNEVGPLISVLIVIFFYFSSEKIVYLFLSIFGFFLFYIFVIKTYISDLTIDSIVNDPRIRIYQMNISRFASNPIFGVGIGGTMNEDNQYQSAHNIFIEVASEFGIVGLIPLFFIIFLLFKRFLRYKNEKFRYLWLYAFIVVQFSGDIALNTVFWGLSGIFVALTDKLLQREAEYLL